MTVAFHDLLVSERSHLRQFASFLAKGRDADDLVQETLCRAMEKQGQFSEGTNLRAWLFTICRNFLYDERRKGGRFVADPDGIFASSLPAREDTGAAVEAKDALSHMADLTDTHRSLLLMSVDGVSLEDMAALQGVPVNTIKSRISRGRASLHRVLGDLV